jgi:ribosome biogenesis GTPase
VNPLWRRMSLRNWGWDAEREEEAAALPSGGWRIGRVIGQGRGLYALTDGQSVRLAAVSGAFGYRAVLPSDYPVTGDFVACREERDTWVIEQVLPRTGTLSRKAAGKKEEEQVLAANIDAAFLVFAVDGGRGFVPRLVERLLTLVRESGATPLILLNKADLAGDRQPYREETTAAAPGVQTLFTSALTGEGLDQLRALLTPGKTFYFLGKSGVGKSSLINALFGQEVMKTAEIRQNDKRGRHTTTRRELFLLPNGALLVDSPGLREAALWAAEASVDDAFPDVASLAGKCRFRDCRHSGEPGCAVQEALAAGSLDSRRYESYLDFKREARYHRLAAGESAQRLERLRWKKISKLAKNLYKDREKSP